MVNVNVVNTGGWILERMAHESIALMKNSKVSATVDPDAKINYFMNYALFEKVPTLKMAYFTHFEPRYEKIWKRAERFCNVGVYMAQMYKPAMFFSHQVYPTGLDVNQSPTLKVGVSGRPYKSGRKGEQILKEIQKIEGVKLCFMGEGWKDLDYLDKNKCYFTKWDGDTKAARFYRGLDVFINTSATEGGPVAVYEAIKARVPKVVMFRAGAIENFADFVEVASNEHHFIEIIRLEALKKGKLSELCSRNWEWFAHAHKQIFDNIGRLRVK